MVLKMRFHRSHQHINHLRIITPFIVRDCLLLCMLMYTSGVVLDAIEVLFVNLVF